MSKKILCFILAVSLTLCLSTGVFAEGETIELSAKAAIAYEPVTGTVLYEKNADERMLIASTTKIMTALIVLENCGLDESVKITPEQAAVEGSTMYLKAGESYSVLDLLYGLMLASGNDAATALAEHTSGSIEAFAELMNARCLELGLQNTHFTNPHGLDNAEHYSSARDLALITAEAMKNETFRTLFSAPSHSVKGIDYYNHNKLLSRCDGCIGGKTGYTEKAGRSLVSCTQREGMTLVCVTISAPDDWNDHMRLYDRLFAKYSYTPVLDSKYSKLEVISGTSHFVNLFTEAEGIVTPGDAKVTKRVLLPPFVFSPVKAGGVAGQVMISIDGGAETAYDVYYNETVFVDKSIILTPWERLSRVWRVAGGCGVYYPDF